MFGSMAGLVFDWGDLRIVGRFYDGFVIWTTQDDLLYHDRIVRRYAGINKSTKGKYGTDS